MTNLPIMHESQRRTFKLEKLNPTNIVFDKHYIFPLI